MDTGYEQNGYGPRWKKHGLHCTLYAPYMQSKETFAAKNEPYSPEVSHKLICVRQAWHLTCALRDFKRSIYRIKRALQCRGVTQIDLCDTSPWYHESCSMLRCVAVCCIVLRCVAVCCALCVGLCETSPWCHMGCSVLQCVAVCCSVLKCVAVWCRVL